MKYHLALCLLGSMLLVGCINRRPEPITTTTTVVVEEAKKPQPISFIILQLNDVYEISPMDKGRVAGMARVAALRKQLQAANPNLITVLDGDYLSPSLIGSLKCDFAGAGKQTVAGRHMVDVMNATGIDYVTFGNHEFDIKEAELLARLDESRFKVISANVFHQTANGQVAFSSAGTTLPRELVHTFTGPDGSTFRLGLTGVTLPFNRAKYVHYLDHYAEAAASVARLQDQSDAVMAITHLTMDMDDTLAQRVPSLALILGGHEHVNMYREVGPSKIAKADANAKTVYIHWCTFDPTTKKTQVWSQLMPITDALPQDPQVAAVVKKWEDFAENCMEAQGYAPDDTLGFYLVALDGREEAIRFHQTNLGALITQSMLDADPKADVAVLNSGSVRLDGVLQNFVLQRDILATLPFGGNIVRGQLKGSQLRQLLDAGLATSIQGNGAYLQVGNVTVTPQGYQVKGKPLQDAQSYQVLMPGFMASGGENLLSFVKDFTTYVEPGLPIGVKNDLRDIIIWDLRQNGNLKLVRQLLDSQR
jgi:2',3'-cyclic-nucleotide 2'-phosphodiesterase (5'-nucleotidase family)